MKTGLSTQQISSYREDGYLLIEDFLDSDELVRWREAAEEAVARRLNAVRQGTASGALKLPLRARLRAPVEAAFGRKGASTILETMRRLFGPKLLPIGFSGVLDTNQGDQHSFYANVYTQIIGSSRENQELRGHVLDPRLGNLAAQLAGVNGVRLYHDQALFKMPQSNFTSWHLDTPYWSFHSKQALTMWLALDDITPENGCMQYLPGTHRTARLDKNLSIGPDFNGLFKLYPEWRNIKPVPCPCRAGAAIFHNGLIAHSAGPNRTDRPRRAYSIAFMPYGSAFNGVKDVMPGEYFKSLSVGDLLDNELIHPLIWKAANSDRE